MKDLGFLLSAMLITATLVAFREGGKSHSDMPINEVTIGKQVWMAENLNTDVFRNGDPIPQAKTAADWKKAGENKQPAWCYYDNYPNLTEIYGKLYNWYAVNDPRGLAPSGWHVPSDEEWTTLTVFLGGDSLAGNKMKKTTGWLWINNGKGTNESGFSGLPRGCRTPYGEFSHANFYAYWWSSTSKIINGATSRLLGYSAPEVLKAQYPMAYGFSVRCIRD